MRMNRWLTAVVIAGLIMGTALAEGSTTHTRGNEAIRDKNWQQFIWDPQGDAFLRFDENNEPVYGTGGRDIYQGVWWTRDSTYDYFRMDLASAPLYCTEQPTWADIYGIYMDGVPGGAPVGTATPAELDGIDWAVTWQVDVFGQGVGEITDPQAEDSLFRFRLWDYAADVPRWRSKSLGDDDIWVHLTTEQQGPGMNTIQWRIPRSGTVGGVSYSLPSMYDITGATHDASSFEPKTYDLTDTATVPEPASMALMGLALAGVAAFKRRRKSED